MLSEETRSFPHLLLSKRTSESITSETKLFFFSEKRSYLFLKYSRKALEAGGGKFFPREIHALPPYSVSRSPWVYLS
jgi:hypothetical protein